MNNVTLPDYAPQVGERVYYTGDMANDERYGVTTALDETRWGVQITITWDDPVGLGWDEGEPVYFDSPTSVISPANFSPSPGRRFYRLAEWQQKRTDAINDFLKNAPVPA